MLARWIVRRLGLDGNPLRRRTDRVETWLTVAMTAALLVTGPCGELTRPPHPHNPTGAALKAGLGAAVGLVTGVACLLLLIRRRLDMRRMASWQIEWIFVEPRWSGRR